MNTVLNGRPAISYIRFSSPKQEHGSSLARQLEGTKEFCRRHDLALNESLSLKDLGKSAFRGKNADSGNLGVFLEAVRENRIPKGTVLVVEALDRLTRNNIVEASHLLTDILRNGIDVGLVSEDKVYSYDYINKNPFEFIVAVTYLIRGGDESRMKSERVKDAWARKKRLITEKKEVTKIPLPCWLKREENKWVVIEEKADVVRQIFREYLDESQGIWMISQSLNNRKVAVITQRAKPNAKWHRITVHRILTDKAVLGTYTNLEEPVENYFPAIISEKQFYAVQAKLKDRYRHRGRHSLKDISLFKGICKCGKCGTTMTRITRNRTYSDGKTTLYRYLYCHNSILGLCQPARAVDLTLLEKAFFAYSKTSMSARLFFWSEGPDESIQNELKSVEGQIGDKMARRNRLVTALEDGMGNEPSVVLERIKTLENEAKALRLKKDELTAALKRPSYGEAPTVDFSKINFPPYNDPIRLKIRELIRQFVSSIVLYPEEQYAMFITISGATRWLPWGRDHFDPKKEQFLVHWNDDKLGEGGKFKMNWLSR